MNNKKLVKRTKEEVSKLVEFARTLIFKNEEEARKNETEVTIKNYFDLRNAYFRLHPFDKERWIYFAKLQDENTGEFYVSIRDDETTKRLETFNFDYKYRSNGEVEKDDRIHKCLDNILFVNPRYSDFEGINTNKSIEEENTDVYIENLLKKGVDLEGNPFVFNSKIYDRIEDQLDALPDEDLKNRYKLYRRKIYNSKIEKYISHFYTDDTILFNTISERFASYFESYFNQNKTFLAFNDFDVNSETSFDPILVPNGNLIKNEDGTYQQESIIAQKSQERDTEYIFAVSTNNQTSSGMFSSVDDNIKNKDSFIKKISDYVALYLLRNKTNCLTKIRFNIYSNIKITEENIFDSETIVKILMQNIVYNQKRLESAEPYNSKQYYDETLVNDNNEVKGGYTDIKYYKLYNDFMKFFISQDEYEAGLSRDEIYDAMYNKIIDVKKYTLETGRYGFNDFTVVGKKDGLSRSNLERFCHELYDNLKKIFIEQNSREKGLILSHITLRLELYTYEIAPMTYARIGESDGIKDNVIFGNHEDLNEEHIPIYQHDYFNNNYSNGEKATLARIVKEIINDNDSGTLISKDFNEEVANDIFYNYDEKNLYYRRLLAKLGYLKQVFVPTQRKINYLKDYEMDLWDGKRFKSEVIDAIIAFRSAEDHDIIFYEDTIIEKEWVKIFLDNFKTYKRYYNNVLHNEGLKQYERYWNYVNFLIVLMALDSLIVKEMELIYDIDYFSEREVRNMFASYGFDFYEDLPMKYRKRILKNLNYLIKNKGTNKAILNIFKIFGFDDIRLLKYILVKHHGNKEINGVKVADPSNPKLYFYKADYNNNDLEDIFSKKEREDFNDVVEDDPFWEASEEEIKYEDFNFLNTKYLGVEIGIDLTKGFFNATYIFNWLSWLENKVVREEKEEYTDKVNPIYYDYDVLKFRCSNTNDKKKYYILDYLYMLYYLVMKSYGYEETVASSIDAIQAFDTLNTKVYDFNKDDRITWKDGESLCKEEFGIRFTVDKRVAGKDYERELNDEERKYCKANWDRTLVYYKNMVELIKSYNKASGNKLLYNLRGVRDTDYIDLILKDIVDPNKVYFTDAEDKFKEYASGKGMQTTRALYNDLDIANDNDIRSLDSFVLAMKRNLELKDLLKKMIYHEDNTDRLFTLMKIFDYKFISDFHYKSYKNNKFMNLKDVIINRGNDKLFEYYNSLPNNRGLLTIIEDLERFFASGKYGDIITKDVNRTFALRNILKNFILDWILKFKAYTTQLNDITFKLYYKDPVDERLKISEFMGNMDSKFAAKEEKLIKDEKRQVINDSLVPGVREMKDEISIFERTTSLDYIHIHDFIRVRKEKIDV